MSLRKFKNIIFKNQKHNNNKNHKTKKKHHNKIFDISHL